MPYLPFSARSAQTSQAVSSAQMPTSESFTPYVFVQIRLFPLLCRPRDFAGPPFARVAEVT